MADLAQVREGLAAALRTIPGLRASAWPNPSPNPPHASVVLQQMDPAATYGLGLGRLRFVVRVLVGRADERSAIERLSAYESTEGPLSVVAALYADRTLGGVADSVRVTSVGNEGVYDLGDVPLAGVEFTVEVLA